jgi:hypothetical protein
MAQFWWMLMWRRATTLPRHAMLNKFFRVIVVDGEVFEVHVRAWDALDLSRP